MSSNQQKPPVTRRSGDTTEPTVSQNSMQSKPPGAVDRSGASVQSASLEQGAASARERGSMQGTQQDEVNTVPGAGSQESPVGPHGSRQSGTPSNAQRQDSPTQSRTNSGSKTARYDDSAEGGGTRYDSGPKREK